MNQPAPRFTIHPDGLSTFIAIASNHIHELARQEQLNQSDITDLNNAMQTALYNIGAAFELLALERMEYSRTNDNPVLCGALATAGRMMIEFSALRDSLDSAQHRLNERTNKPNTP